jgi:hypothetical protein
MCFIINKKIVKIIFSASEEVIYMILKMTMGVEITVQTQDISESKAPHFFSLISNSIFISLTTIY